MIDTLITLEDSLKLIKETLENMKFDKNYSTCKLDEAAGYFLGERIYAPFDLPEYNNSAMDGIAVSSINQEYKIIPYTNEIPTNCAVEVSTGQKIPLNTLTIIEKENYIKNLEKVSIKEPEKVKPQKHIRLKGEEIKKGDLIFDKYTQILPSTIGVLAKIGKSKVKVIKMPKVAIIITGNELVEPGDNKNDDKIFNSNGPLLKSLFKEIKIKVNKYALVKDDPDILKSHINDFLNHSDILVITGGASVGKFDLSRKILEDLKFKKVFYKVAIKPGKPTYFYAYENKLIFGLPGNPLAVFTGFFLFIKPTLKYLLTNNFSLDTIKLKNYEIEVEGKVDPHRTNIIPAYIDFSQNKVKAKVIGSNQLLALTHSNCLLILEKQEAIMI